jgi:aspartate kinase
MEEAIISEIVQDRGQASITVIGVPDRIGTAAEIFQTVSTESNVDMIVQNPSPAVTRHTDISFTLPETDRPKVIAALDAVRDEIGFADILYDDHISKVSLVGVGMRSHPGVTAAFFGALASTGVNMDMISTSEIQISVVVAEHDSDDAVSAARAAFGLHTTGVPAAYVRSGPPPHVAAATDIEYGPD